MKLSEKRKIVKRFREGESPGAIGLYENGKNGVRPKSEQMSNFTVEMVIRDFMNGKFSMEPTIPYRQRQAVALKRDAAKRKKARSK